MCSVVKLYLNPFCLNGGNVCVDGDITQGVALKIQPCAVPRCPCRFNPNRGDTSEIALLERFSLAKLVKPETAEYRVVPKIQLSVRFVNPATADISDIEMIYPIPSCCQDTVLSGSSTPQPLIYPKISVCQVRHKNGNWFIESFLWLNPQPLIIRYRVVVKIQFCQVRQPRNR